MTLKTRKIISLVFILIFFIATPAIILYALGYNLNLGWPPKFNHALQKTGMLILDSKPEGAKILLNNEEKIGFFNNFFNKNSPADQTPVKIKNLPPGDYNVKLELNDYWPWEKKLTVSPGSSTFAENIILFKKNLPLLILPSKQIASLSVSNDQKNTVINTAEGLQLFNSNEEIKIFTASSSLQLKDDFIWSPLNDMIIIGDKILFTNDPKTTIDLGKILGKPENIKWADEKSIYYANVNSINIYNISSQKNTSLYRLADVSGVKSVDKNPNKERINDYIINNNTLFLISNTDDKNNFLEIIDLSKQQITKEIILPKAKTLKLKISHSNILEIYNPDQETLYLVDSQITNSTINLTLNNIIKYHWIDDTRILGFNNFEIKLIDVPSKKIETLTRISSRINNVIWHPSNNYVIYSTDNSIYSLELDNREKHNITELIKFEEIDKIFLNKDANALYFSGKLNQQSGLFKLAI